MGAILAGVVAWWQRAEAGTSSVARRTRGKSVKTLSVRPNFTSVVMLSAIFCGGAASAQHRTRHQQEIVLFEGWCPGLSWQPGGERLLCWRRDGASGIVELRHGAEPIPLLATSVSGFAWSPDGSQIAGLVWQEQTTSLVLLNADGSNRRERPLSAPFSRPLWRPDGAEIWFARHPQTVAVAASGGGDERVVPIGTSPSWRPDGGSIAFVRAHLTGASQYSDLMVAGPAGADPTQRGRFEGSLAVTYVHWSPNGRWIAVTGSSPGDHQAHLSVLDLTTTNGQFTRLSDDVTGDDFAWSPDGSEIVASVYAAGNRSAEGNRFNRFSLVSFDIEGGRSRVVARPGRGQCRCWLPTWSTHGLAYQHQCVGRLAGSQVRLMQPPPSMRSTEIGRDQHVRPGRSPSGAP